MLSGIDAEPGQDRATPRARLAAEEMLDAWLSGQFARPLDRLVQSEFRARRHLNSGERRWISATVYGTARYLRRQRWILRTRGLELTSVNLVQQWMEGPREMDSGNFAPQFHLPGPDVPRDFLHDTLSFPDAMAAEMEALLGAEAVPAGEAFNRQAPTMLRVNTLRASMKQALARLPHARPSRFSPLALELPHRPNIHDLPGFKEGWFELQEEASQLAALLCNAQPGQTIVDLGAGAGGKSLALSAMMQNRGRLYALDIASRKLAELEKRAKRAGARNIKPVELTAIDTEVWQLSEESLRKIDNLHRVADCVLLDAPCTGSGVLRRSPDAKWRQNDTKAFARLQAALLEKASTFVAMGGALVYVTCAFERAQNEAVVEGFLQSDAGKEFVNVPVLPRLEAGIRRAESLAGQTGGRSASEDVDLAALTSGPFLRTWPHRHNMDAFFAACLQRSPTGD